MSSPLEFSLAIGNESLDVPSSFVISHRKVADLTPQQRKEIDRLSVGFPHEQGHEGVHIADSFVHIMERKWCILSRIQILGHDI